MSALASLCTRLRDEVVASDTEEFEAGLREGEEGEIVSPQAPHMRRVGWLVGRYRRLEGELERARAEAVDRIQAAIADVRGEAQKRAKSEELRMLEIIKDWRERALAAEKELSDEAYGRGVAALAEATPEILYAVAETQAPCSELRSLWFKLAAATARKEGLLPVSLTEES